MLDHAFGDIFETVSPDPASRKAIERVHDPDYLDWLVEFCADGGGRIEDTTTGLNEHTYDAARVSAGLLPSLPRDKRLTGRKTMGKRRSPMRCVAPAATTPSPIAQTDSVTSTTSRSQRRLRSLLTDGPADITADRVAIIDWDVHHGNGTRDIL